jgi:EmrB/QacA subfamily drug resistance transporter
MYKPQTLVVLIAILASFVAFLDGAIVNVALPAIQSDLGGGLSIQQWIVDAFLLTLGSFILLAGSLSDLFGRKKILAYGLVGFGISSLLCAIAPNATTLIIARSLQGLSGALLVPSSLALIAAYLSGKDFSKAIGQWTAWTGIAFIIGPLVGGLLTDAVNWRLIFAINVLPIAVTLFLLKLLPQEPKPDERPKVDLIGAVLGVLGLGGTVFALIEQSRLGWSNPAIYLSFALGVLLLIWFVWHEYRIKQPMLPLNLFQNRNFSVGNLATFAIYAGLAAFTFILIIYLQQHAGYTALQSGLSMIPVTIIMFLFSSLMGKAAATYGPRWFMAIGPIIAGIGLLILSYSATGEMRYWTQVMPGVIVYGIGLTVTVAPLTAAILGGINKASSGVASAVNNAVARVAGLLAVAALGIIFQNNLSSFKITLIYIGGIIILGGIISGIGITNKVREN